MEKSMMRRLWVLVAGGVVLYWALTNHVVLFGWIGRLWSVVSPLVAGGAIAFILNVPVRSLERRIFRKGRKPFRRAMSILITLLCVMLGLAAVMLIVIPELVGALENLVSALPSFLDSLKLFGESMGERYPDVGFWLEELDISWTSMKSSLTGLLRDGSARLVGTTVNFASSLVGKLVQFLLAAVFSIYLLARKEHLKSQAKRALAAYLPDRHVERILHAARLVNATFSKFVIGTCTEAVILGLMLLVSMLLFRFPYALLVAALVSVSAFIPIVGAFIAAVVGMLLCSCHPCRRSGFSRFSWYCSRSKEHHLPEGCRRIDRIARIVGTGCGHDRRQPLRGHGDARRCPACCRGACIARGIDRSSPEK